MIRRRSVKIPSRQRATLQARLSRQLMRKAFDNYYACAQCGCHEDLQIHHLYYDPKRFDVPGAYEILCRKCHNKKKKGG